MSLSSQIRYVKAYDTSATDGSGKTGLAFGDITAKYLIHGGTLTSLTTETITTLGTYQAPSDAAHIRIKELAGSAPTTGIYEVHFHDTQLANTGKKLWLFLSATGARFLPLEMDLITYADLVAVNADNLASAASNYSATRGLAGTALPAVASGSANSLARSSDGSAVNITSGKIDSVTLVDTTTTNTDMRGTNSAALASTFTGITSMAQWLGLLAGKQTGNSTARTEVRATGGGSGTFDETTDSQEALRDRGDTSWITATGFSTFNPASDTVARVTLVDTTTTNTDMRGTNSAALAATALSTATWTNTLATNLTTLAGHDPGATLGTSTLTQTQVTGGAYALNSSSFAFNAALPFTTTQLASTIARVTLVDTTTTNSDMRGTNSAALASTFTGITSMAQWLGLLAGKQTGNSTARTEVRATGAGSGTFDETTDSQEALRDRGDAAWVTATGFSTFNPASDTVAHVTLVDTTTTNTDMRGTNSAALAATALSTATWTNTLATNLTTLAGHDPGATLGTSTLTQTQVTGGAYALNSSSFAFNAALDFTTTMKTSIGTAVAASAVASVTGTTGGMTAAGWAGAFTVNSTKTYADAVAGSLVKETADNAGGSSLTLTDIAETVCEYMFTFDTGSVYADAIDGSAVKEIGENAGGGGLTVQGIVDGVFNEVAGVHTGLIPTALTRIGSAAIEITSPLAADGTTLVLVSGDDYYNADQRAITFTDSGGTLPTFIGGTAVFQVNDGGFTTSLTVVDANTLRLELSAANTTTIRGLTSPQGQGRYSYDVRVTLVSGHKVTVTRGTLRVLDTEAS